MSISRDSPRPLRPTLRRALDVLGLAVALAFLPELALARAGAVLEPHPGWIAVLVLAARYGGRGLFAGLIAAAGAVAIAAQIAGTGLVAPWSRLDSAPDLIAFAACLIVSGVASRHLRRQADLGEQLGALRDRAAEAKATIETLRDVAATLRARVDRTSTSLSFLRDVATRLEGADPVAAAEAATELATVRTGACAAAVEVGPNGFQRFLAVRDARGPKALAPLTLHSADLNVPIRDGDDPIGVIALWGIPRSALDDATLHDLAVIAAWCAPAVAIAAWRPEAAAGRAQGVT